eukprot:10326128-Lingulodinium_polyedra.AAC.1
MRLGARCRAPCSLVHVAVLPVPLSALLSTPGVFCSLQHYLGRSAAQLHECAACGPLRRDVLPLSGL